MHDVAIVTLYAIMQIFITEHAMQDNTTTTVKDTQHTIVLATIILIIVAGIGGGIADVTLWGKYKTFWFSG